MEKIKSSYDKDQIWVSYSSISDYLRCPRSYFLKNIYKDEMTGHKIMLITPHLSMGSAVHDVLESLLDKPVEYRLKIDLKDILTAAWDKITGEKGGFLSQEQEEYFKKRASSMIEYITNNPGPLANKTVKLNDFLPKMYLSKEEKIILCGKIDWLEYNDDNTLNIIDFKTGKGIEKNDSLQLPIYVLLTEENQSRKVKNIYYWYLEYKMKPQLIPFNDREAAKARLYDAARSIRLARLSKQFKCKTGGCRDCEPYERIIKGEGKLIGVGSMKKDMYILPLKDE